MAKDVAGFPLEDRLDLGAVEEDIVDVRINVTDEAPLPITEPMSKVVMAKDKHLVVMGQDLGQI